MVAGWLQNARGVVLDRIDNIRFVAMSAGTSASGGIAANMVAGPLIRVALVAVIVLAVGARDLATRVGTLFR